MGRGTIIRLLNQLNIPLNEVICVWRFGSSLYVDNTNDTDIRAIVKSNKYVGQFKVDDYDVCVMSKTYWNSIKALSESDITIQQSHDFIKLYGDDNGLKKYDCIHDKDNIEWLLNIYDIYFFNCCERSKKLKAKLLYNFLIFAYRVLNHSSILTQEQKETIQKAHDNELDMEDYRYLLEKIKEEL